MKLMNIRNILDEQELQIIKEASQELEDKLDDKTVCIEDRAKELCSKITTVTGEAWAELEKYNSHTKDQEHFSIDIQTIPFLPRVSNMEFHILKNTNKLHDYAGKPQLKSLIDQYINNLRPLWPSFCSLMKEFEESYQEAKKYVLLEELNKGDGKKAILYVSVIDHPHLTRQDISLTDTTQEKPQETLYWMYHALQDTSREQLINSANGEPMFLLHHYTNKIKWQDSLKTAVRSIYAANGIQLKEEEKDPQTRTSDVELQATQENLAGPFLSSTDFFGEKSRN
ncbi:hypothetical protein HQ545_05155 [Candidatus Woesearchaeota archaeon]|nr:hypothetical protein [Candidatus Woesearchaeota archaeon]